MGSLGRVESWPAAIQEQLIGKCKGEQLPNPQVLITDEAELRDVPQPQINSVAVLPSSLTPMWTSTFKA